jgi:hypothetical protein
MAKTVKKTTKAPKTATKGKAPASKATTKAPKGKVAAKAAIEAVKKEAIATATKAQLAKATKAPKGKVAAKAPVEATTRPKGLTPAQLKTKFANGQTPDVPVAWDKLLGELITVRDDGILYTIAKGHENAFRGGASGETWRRVVAACKGGKAHTFAYFNNALGGRRNTLSGAVRDGHLVEVKGKAKGK